MGNQGETLGRQATCSHVMRANTCQMVDWATPYRLASAGWLVTPRAYSVRISRTTASLSLRAPLRVPRWYVPWSRFLWAFWRLVSHFRLPRRLSEGRPLTCDASWFRLGRLPTNASRTRRCTGNMRCWPLMAMLIFAYPLWFCVFLRRGSPEHIDMMRPSDETWYRPQVPAMLRQTSSTPSRAAAARPETSSAPAGSPVRLR